MMMTHVLKMLFPKAIIYLLEMKNLLLSANNNRMLPPKAMLKTSKHPLFAFHCLWCFCVEDFEQVTAGGYAQNFGDVPSLWFSLHLALL